jgi:hypothetical protein
MIELCKQLTDAKNDILREDNPKEKAWLYDLIVAVQLTRALQENDLPSFKELVNRCEGMVAQKSRTGRCCSLWNFPACICYVFMFN